MVNAESLFKAYEKRRYRFLGDLQTDPNKVIRDKLLHCVFTVDLCLHTFQALASNLHKVTEYLKKEIDESRELHNEFKKYLKDSKSNIDRIIDENLRRDQFEMVEAVANQHNDIQRFKYLVADINSQALELSISSAITTLPVILESDDSHYVREAVIKLLMNIISIFPGGAVVPGLYDVIQILRARRDRANSASSYLDALDSFLSSAYNWCIATQLLIDLLEKLESIGEESFEVSYEIAASKVGDRFSEIVDRIKK